MSGRDSIALKEIRNRFFPTTLSRDLLNLIAGEHLGGGICREVFVYEFDKTKVVKFETGSGDFQNVLEWTAWEDLKGEKGVGEYLAPCRYISANGSILIQDRTYAPPQNFKWPAKVPHFWTDMKRGNFGLIDRKLVCHDYGRNLFIRGGVSKALRRAKWWDEG